MEFLFLGVSTFLVASGLFLCLMYCGPPVADVPEDVFESIEPTWTTTSYHPPE